MRALDDEAILLAPTLLFLVLLAGGLGTVSVYE
jgi:hypothetical protein